jgi:hypothetical protein
MRRRGDDAMPCRVELIRVLDPALSEDFNDAGRQSELGWIVDNIGMRR